MWESDSPERTIYSDIREYGTLDNFIRTMLNMNELNIRYYRTAFELEPVYGSEDAACFDLRADLGAVGRQESFANEYVCHTGLYVEIPKGHVGLIYVRSGLAFKENLMLANGTGVIDSDYRGEILVKLVDNTSHHKSHIIRHADRVAQMMIMPAPRCNLIPVNRDELLKTKRGQNGFGSTGK